MAEFREIQKLKFPDDIRTRYALYAGSNENSTILFRELIDNTIDVYLASKKNLDVLAFSDSDYHLVMDTGVGLPIYEDKDYKDQSIVMDLLTNLHVGSNFDRNRKYPSTGLNGVGSKITVAASEDFYAIVNVLKSYPKSPTENIYTSDKPLPQYLCEQYKEKKAKGKGMYFLINFHQGILQEQGIFTGEELLAKLSHLDEKTYARVSQALIPQLGTVILFKPDLTIVDSAKVSYTPFSSSLITKYFPADKDYKGSTFNITLNGEKPAAFDFHSYFKDEEFFTVGDQDVFEFSFNVPTEEQFPIKIMGSLAFSKTQMDWKYGGSVNLLNTPEGLHINLFAKALGKALSEYNEAIKPADVKYGLRQFVLMIGLKPEFDSQLKTRFVRFFDQGFDAKSLIELLAASLRKLVIDKNRDYFDALCNKIIEYKKSLDLLSHKDYILSNIKYADSKDPTKSIGFGTKVYDCSSKSIGERELYLVEGGSAGGSIVRNRNPKTVAVLPLRGVVLNSTKVDLQRIVENKEFQTLITVLGTGVELFIDMEKKRYSKVIIACDADDSGKFITALLLGFFGKYLRPWIDEGLVYVLDSPLYKQGGKYIYNNEDFDKSKPFSRFKGLTY